MGCNCGKPTKFNMTSAQLEAQRVRDELNMRIQAESNKAATGEHAAPVPVPQEA